MVAYTSLIDMYSDLSKMTEDQQKKVQKAWVGFLTSHKSQTTASISVDDTGIVYDRTLEPCFDALIEEFAEEFATPVSDEFGNVTLMDFRMCLRQSTHRNGMAVGKCSIKWPQFLTTCYRVFYDQSPEKRQTRIKKARLLGVFYVYDTNYDDFLNPHEFMALCKDQFPTMSEQDIKDTMKQIDLDMDGEISEREFLIWGIFGAGLDKFKPSVKDEDIADHTVFGSI